VKVRYGELNIKTEKKEEGKGMEKNVKGADAKGKKIKNS